MAYKVQKPCKVCGKLYTPCYDCEKDNSVFHWRTVACSVECGKKYFEMVMKARDVKTDEKDSVDKNIVIETNVNEIIKNTDVVEKEKRILKKRTTKTINKEESEQIG